MLYADFRALAQVGMRLRLQTRGHARFKRADLGVRNHGRLALKGHESQDPGSPKNAQSVPKIEVHEDITREQRHVQFLAAILPSTYAAVDRKKVVQSLVFEMTSNHLLVPRTNRNRVPVPDRQRLFGAAESSARNGGL